MSGEHTPSVSDEEEDDLDCTSPQPQLPELQGTLSKWTNYLHGWQERWVVLSGGTLAYYKTEYDTAFGCRGSMSVAKATIQPHEFDECRFDVSVNDCVYYLRAADGDTRQKWVDVLGTIKAAESGYGSESSLRKGGSLLSLSSVTSLTTTASGSSFKKGRGLREKLMELETFRDIVCQQIDTLQNYFDACAGVFSSQKQGVHHDSNEQHDDLFGSNDGLDHDADDEMEELSTTPTPASLIQDIGNQSNRRVAFDSCDNNPTAMLSATNLKAIDFRGEAITFKATTSGILATLQHCIDVMNKREENLQRRLDRETEKRKKAEAAVKAAVLTAQKRAFIGGPDFEEGPHSVLNEEEFYDAIEVALDRQDEEDALEEFQGSTFVPSDAVGEESVHRLTAEVNAKVKKGLQIVLENVDHNWYLVHEDGEMKVYRREFEEGGVVLDPMKATHIVEGVTAREMANYFFDKRVRMDWDSTLETAKVVEQLSESTIIMYQVHKRMWPSSQRDTCFLSHIRNVPAIDAGDRHENEVGCPWLVCNYSVEHPDAPQNKYVRAIMAVTLFCQTLIEPRGEGKKLNRDLISCKMTYTANINPGGWAPPSVVRAVSKREYPKFLRKISSFCQNACKDKPISM